MDYALVSEQGVTFAVVVVKPHILNSPASREKAQIEFAQHFTLGTPIILMAQNVRGIPKYYGRKDIVRFLSSIDHRRLPWKRKSI